MMDLPLRAFWALNRQIDRLRAEEDLRKLSVGVMAQASRGEQLEPYQDTLRQQIGTVIVEKAIFDRGGLAALKEIGQN
jgi:hypothetical protein